MKKERLLACVQTPPLPSGKIEFSWGEEGVCTQAKRLLAVYAVIGKKKQTKTSQWFSEWILKCSFTCLFLLLVNWVGSVHVFWKTVLNSLIVLSLKFTSHLELPTFRIPLVFHQSHSKKSKIKSNFCSSVRLQTLEGLEASSVRDALKTWQDNYVNVQGVMDEFVSLRERTKYLRDEVRVFSFLPCSP